MSGTIQEHMATTWVVMREALEAVLLFHSAGMWREEDRTKWFNITQSDEATTKVLCDTVRAALRKSNGEDL